MSNPRTSTARPKASERIKNWRPRRSALGDEENPFFIPSEVIPYGMSWEFKRYSCLGMDDRDHMLKLARDGAWESVMHEEWPDRLGEFGRDGQPIIIGGMILMQRPLEYTAQSQEEELAKATGSVQNHLQSLQIADGPVPKAKPILKRGYSTQLVPDDAE